MKDVFQRWGFWVDMTPSCAPFIGYCWILWVLLTSGVVGLMTQQFLRHGIYLYGFDQPEKLQK